MYPLSQTLSGRLANSFFSVQLEKNTPKDFPVWEKSWLDGYAWSVSLADQVLEL
jgi:hypothetical protein